MKNSTLQIKIKQRLNKLSSSDFDNLECWMIAEAFNKVQLEWSRRQIIGYNQRREGAEASNTSIDDLQVLVTETPGTFIWTKETGYYQSASISTLNYLGYKTVNAIAKNDCCTERRMVTYLSEVANKDDMLLDVYKRPSFDWGETFANIENNRVRVYTNDEFELSSVKLVYYRKPRDVQFNGCIDINTGNTFSADVECEFKDDITEILIDEAASVLSGDIEAFNQYQREQGKVDKNT